MSLGWITGQFRRRPFELVSPLSIEACLDRLDEKMIGPFDAKAAMGSFSGPPLVGSVVDWRVRLYRQWSFNPVLTLDLVATLQPAGGGTRISGSTGPSGVTLFIVFAWAGCAVLAALGFLTGPRDASAFLFFGFYVVGLACTLVIGLPDVTSLEESTLLINRLKHWLEAEPLAKDSPGVD